jgi:hypothetical protein
MRSIAACACRRANKKGGGMKNTREVPCYYYEGANGKLYRKTNWWLEDHAARALEAVRNDFQENVAPGRKFPIVSAGRTHAEQAYLKKIKPTLAATPGRSWHEAGMAIDIAVAYLLKTFTTQSALEAFMAKHGWIRTVKKENWHFEYHGFWPREKGVTGAIAYIENNK